MKSTFNNFILLSLIMLSQSKSHAMFATLLKTGAKLSRTRFLLQPKTNLNNLRKYSKSNDRNIEILSEQKATKKLSEITQQNLSKQLSEIKTLVEFLEKNNSKLIKIKSLTEQSLNAASPEDTAEQLHDVILDIHLICDEETDKNQVLNIANEKLLKIKSLLKDESLKYGGHEEFYYALMEIEDIVDDKN